MESPRQSDQISGKLIMAGMLILSCDKYGYDVLSNLCHMKYLLLVILSLLVQLILDSFIFMECQKAKRFLNVKIDKILKQNYT